MGSGAVDYVAFGLEKLQWALEKMPTDEPIAYLDTVSIRLDFLDDTLYGLGINVPAMFRAVGANYQNVVKTVLRRRQQIFDSLAQPLAA